MRMLFLGLSLLGSLCHLCKAQAVNINSRGEDLANIDICDDGSRPLTYDGNDGEHRAGTYVKCYAGGVCPFGYCCNSRLCCRDRGRVGCADDLGLGTAAALVTADANCGGGGLVPLIQNNVAVRCPCPAGFCCGADGACYSRDAGDQRSGCQAYNCNGATQCPVNMECVPIRNSPPVDLRCCPVRDSAIVSNLGGGGGIASSGTNAVCPPGWIREQDGITGPYLKCNNPGGNCGGRRYGTGVAKCFGSGSEAYCCADERPIQSVLRGSVGSGVGVGISSPMPRPSIGRPSLPIISPPNRVITRPQTNTGVFAPPRIGIATRGNVYPPRSVYQPITTQSLGVNQNPINYGQGYQRGAQTGAYVSRAVYDSNPIQGTSSRVIYTPINGVRQPTQGTFSGRVYPGTIQTAQVVAFPPYTQQQQQQLQLQPQQPATIQVYG